MENVPVLIFHQNYKDYLKVNCQITSKNNNLIVLGDSSCEKLKNISNVTFFDIKDFLNKEKMEYFKQYSHLSFNTKTDSTWLWYFRVFIIGEFLKKSNIKQVFHVDSDNILLENINLINFQSQNAYFILKDWKEINMTGSIHSGLTNIDFYIKFEKLYEDLFINKSKFNLIEKKIEYHKQFGNGGICDMTLFYLLNKLSLIEVENLIYPIKSGDERVIFMNNFNEAESYLGLNQFEMNGNYIKIIKDKKRKKNYVHDLISNEYLKLINIHFQGKAKRKMNLFLKNKIYY